ncbi:WXG100 family type VII secretion target [Nocardia sp. 348MFTsu5.1]|jgi:WXG100 family type VII secretion target|uniref:WXG100 family type VII secretion target n=1 Tax=Nocardia sp. 348MFTsu5.1 TaxID=1172185 RepID=UPI000367BD89|nr:WXG100 family type VII secretion target [Nocardia sp. 348MFTsu5.1]
MIKYNFAAIDELSTQLDSDFKQLEELAGTLKSEVARLHSNWESPQAAEAYGVAQQRWDTSFSDSRQLLTNLSTKVRDAGTTMQGADKRTAGYFT